GLGEPRMLSGTGEPFLVGPCEKSSAGCEAPSSRGGTRSEAERTFFFELTSRHGWDELAGRKQNRKGQQCYRSLTTRSYQRDKTPVDDKTCLHASLPWNPRQQRGEAWPSLAIATTVD